MTSNPKLVAHGSVGGVPINVDLSRVEHGFTQRVRLTANYSLFTGGGIPTRPSFTGASQQNLEYPRTIASGTYLTLLAGEAAALIAAGAATAA
jgi:hypothetical protein